MSELIMVEGQDCLDYINKEIGFGSREDIDNQSLDTYADRSGIYVRRLNPNANLMYTYCKISTRLAKMKHNTSKRIIGLVTKRYQDGGLRVALLGDETLNAYTNFTVAESELVYQLQIKYKHAGITDEYVIDPDYTIPMYPTYENINLAYDSGQKSMCFTRGDSLETEIPFDEAIDYIPEFKEGVYPFGHVCRYQGVEPLPNNITNFTLTNDKDNTLVFGEGVINTMLHIDEELKDNPLSILSGNLYGYITYLNGVGASYMPSFFPNTLSFNGYVGTNTYGCEDYNLVCIPYNIILTESEQFATEYLANGTLPPDAFLYPLDWDNLPRYDGPVPTGDEPDDYPDDNNPDDDERDFDPTPNETPTYTVNQLTNYNWYWLSVPQWHDFIKWFWNDIGNYSDFDDIIAKIKGLYNDVASAVIMCRYYPVDISWIGGLGSQSNIKLGMIEKAGTYDTISQASPLRSVDIGHVHIGQKYKSFMDMSPYSQLSLYLPWHGFIDLDMNLFNGHDVYVKALYDYLSGTIQYYVFYDNEVLVNTILCKMAMDIPITLQTKNDRDSAIFNNVSSTIGGLVGAGAGILSGNPIGMALGVTQGVGAFNSANASAPMRLMGNVGESGAYIGCQNCFVVVRRPTIQASDGKKKDTEVDTSIDRLTTWKKNVGMLCGYGYTLSSLSGKGFTVCHSPRINFTNTAPLQSEVDEIYNYLEKGVIL